MYLGIKKCVNNLSEIKVIWGDFHYFIYNLMTNITRTLSYILKKTTNTIYACLTIWFNNQRSRVRILHLGTMHHYNFHTTV
jgi:hypothetical protein